MPQIHFIEKVSIEREKNFSAGNICNSHYTAGKIDSHPVSQ